MDNAQALTDKLKDMRIFFAVPAYSGEVAVNFLTSFVATTQMLTKSGIYWELKTIAGDCYVAKARNRCVSAFMESDCTHLFFLDADMGWDYKGVSKVIIRDNDVVLGAYRTKSDEVVKYPLIFDREEDGGFKFQAGLVKLKAGPTGFMCIKRHVIEKLQEKHPELKYSDSEELDGYNLFHCDTMKLPDREENVWVGEDLWFCDLVNKAGMSVWCVPDIDFTHTGMKIWNCNLSQDDPKTKANDDT